MHRNALAAGTAAAILILAMHEANAAARLPGWPHLDGAVQPAVVMFNLAPIRHHIPDTLIELIGAAVPWHSLPEGCAAHPGSAPASADSRLSRDPPAPC